MGAQSPSAGVGPQFCVCQVSALPPCSRPGLELSASAREQEKLSLPLGPSC